MKKLMFAVSAALCATVGFSDVTSANVVGYQNMDVGGFDMACNTFRQIGVAEADMTLGAIGVNSVYDKDTLELVSGWDMEADMILLYDASGKNLGNFFCLPQAYEDVDPGFYEGPVGWHSSTFFEEADCVNDFNIPFGAGILVKAKDGINAKLVFNGEVKQAPADTPVGAFTITGNCSPVPLKLGDITVNSVYDGDTLELLAGWDMEADMILLYDASGKNLGNFFCLPQAYEDVDPGFYEGPVGWHSSTFFEEADCVNDYPLPAGAAFLVKAKDGISPVITVPSPIKASAE